MKPIDRVRGKKPERILKYVTGILYFYGVISFDGLYQILNETIEPDIDREEFQLLIDSNASLEKTPYIFKRQEDWYYDIEVADIERVLEAQKKHAEIPFRPVSEDETRLVVDEQFPRLWNNKEEAVYTWLMNKCKDVQLSIALTLEYAAEVKNGMSAEELLQKVEKQLKLGQATDEIKKMVFEFAFATPQWILKGWSAEELEKNKHQEI
ncbi:hypothetical protein [Dethiobacter alkaliphilus]|uniref:hypothetical protein n=1 Tax=Dethiobacter alkaliphilus TaxID=427926 RepID=UPI0022279D59|nr:hypothetical protein [Dethiobacter alkaliphilus]MCW3490171.1 hypothetical protein [Dethiobacter alkaliphilus]